MTCHAALDLRAYALGDRARAVISCFQQLEPGESFIFVTDRDPRPYLLELQTECPGRFEWGPIEEGPATWRVEVARRRDEPRGPRSISEYLSADHRRLRAVFQSVLRATTEGQPEVASRRWQEFEGGLRRHIRMEEEFLFPKVADHLGGEQFGPVHVMRDEHVEIKRLLGEMGDAVRDRRPDDLFRVADELWGTLACHDQKEEQILYPLSDQILGEGGADELVRRMLQS